MGRSIRIGGAIGRRPPCARECEGCTGLRGCGGLEVVSPEIRRACLGELRGMAGMVGDDPLEVLRRDGRSAYQDGARDMVCELGHAASP